MAYLKPFNINGNDIQFLLDQINFRPLFRMVNGQLQVVIAWDGTGAIFDQWGNPLWDGIAGALTPAQAMGQFGTSYANVNDASGLRQVSGDFNNLQPGQQHWGAVDQPFERMVKADYSHYVSSSIAGYVSGAPAAGLIAPVDSSHPMADAAAAAIALAGLDTSHQNTANTTTVANVASTYAVPGFPGLTIDTVDRTTKLSNTTTTFFDGHHVKANWGETASSVTTTADTYYVAANGAETNLTNTAAVTSTESTGPKISGGELDAAYHGQLRAFDPLNPQNYVAGLERNTDGSVNVTNAANFDYTVSFANTTTSTPTMHSVIDYTPRMISQLIASGGVVTLKDADGHRVDWNPGLYNATSGTPTEQSSYKALIDNWNLAHAAGTAGHIDLTKLVEGAAIVTDYGMVGQSGGQDTQNPNSSDIYIGSANPGIAATNGIFTLFGQFFDHGLDFIGKGSQYKIIIPLAVDDPLYGVTGADGNPTTSITITRATVSGQDANGNATYLNHTSPYIDQSQTYGSADTVTNILREWVKDPNSPTHYIAGASLLDGQTMKTWTDANGNDTTKTLPTLAELRAHIDATGRDALTWEDVAGDLRPRDASGHVIAGGSGQPLLLDMNPPHRRNSYQAEFRRRAQYRCRSHGH